MAYVINKSNGDQLVVLEDGTIDTSTSVGLVGKNYVGYGEIQNENFLWMLENFANDAPPSRPLTGQIWFNTDNNSANVYDGTTWAPIGSATVSSTEPENKNIGSLWLRTTDNTLQVWNETSWAFIGPESLPGYGTTRARALVLKDTDNKNYPVVAILTNDKTVAIFTSSSFNLHPDNYISGFDPSLSAGINLPSTYNIKGNITGNAGSANRLSIARTINGVPFDAQEDITIKSSTTKRLLKGDYILGSNFDGSAETTWSVDASSSNVIGKLVARNSEGGFSAGTITATFVGNLTGNVSASSGTSFFDTVQANTFIGASLTGNAFSASKLQISRKINGIPFDGTNDITITASAETLTGESLNPAVTMSSLVQVGTLSSLAVNSPGVTIGNASQFKMYVDSATNKSLILTHNQGLYLQIADPTQDNGKADFSFISSSVALSEGASARPAFVGDANNTCNIGLPGRRFNTVYGVRFDGISTSAEYADLAENYLADAEYEPGTVLEFGGEFEVTLAEDETRRVAGVVSTKPANLMNAGLQGKFVVPLALQGRVPCKVRGEIRKGDMLTSSGSGFARKTTSPQLGTIIGKALEDFSGIEGIIEVAVGRL